MRSEREGKIWVDERLEEKSPFPVIAIWGACQVKLAKYKWHSVLINTGYCDAVSRSNCPVRSNQSCSASTRSWPICWPKIHGHDPWILFSCLKTLLLLLEHKKRSPTVDCSPPTIRAVPSWPHVQVGGVFVAASVVGSGQELLVGTFFVIVVMFSTPGTGW